MEQISKYLTLNSAINHPVAEFKHINNHPNWEQMDNIKWISKNIYDKIVDKFNYHPNINLFFACDTLSDIIKEDTNSEHRRGRAIQMDCLDKGLTNQELFKWLMENVEFDQLIAEHPQDDDSIGWIYVSLKKEGENRKQVLLSYWDNGVKYLHYTPENFKKLYQRDL